MDQSLEQLQGVVERVTFHNQDSGFCALRVKAETRHESVRVIGSAINIAEGEHIDCQGIWKQDERYGLQFQAKTIQLILPNTVSGIEKYLGSGLIKGVGPGLAKRLIEAFGDQLFDVIDNHPDQLMALPGIGKKRKKQLLASWQAQKAVRDSLLFLQSYGMAQIRYTHVQITP